MIIGNPENKPLAQYPRNIVLAAEKYLKDSGIADTMLILPEFEFYPLDFPLCLRPPYESVLAPVLGVVDLRAVCLVSANCIGESVACRRQNRETSRKCKATI